MGAFTDSYAAYESISFIDYTGGFLLNSNATPVYDDILTMDLSPCGDADSNYA